MMACSQFRHWFVIRFQCSTSVHLTAVVNSGLGLTVTVGVGVGMGVGVGKGNRTLVRGSTGQ